MTDRFGVDPSYAATQGTGRKVLRRGLIVVGVIVALNLAIVILGRWLDPQTSGPFGSSYVTTEVGVGAWHDVLVDLDRAVEQSRIPFPESTFGESTTVVVVNPDSDEFDRGYADALVSHARSGGRVLLVGVEEEDSLFDLAFRQEVGEEGSAEAVSDPLTGDVEEVAVGESMRYVGSDLDVLVADDAGAVVVRWDVGDGELITISGPWMFTNGRIDQGDNAILAVRLTGGGVVVFDEYVHGFGADTGFSGLAATIMTVVIVGVVAALVAMWAGGKRIGPPEQLVRALPPARAEYLDAMARTLMKTNDKKAFEILRVRAVRNVNRIGSRYVGLDPLEQRVKAASQMGLSTEELAVITQPATTNRELAAVAAVAAKIERRRVTRWTS